MKRVAFVSLLLVGCTWNTYDGKNRPDSSTGGDANTTGNPCGLSGCPQATCCIPDKNGAPMCGGGASAADFMACPNGTYLVGCSATSMCAANQVCCVTLPTSSEQGPQLVVSCVAPSACPAGQTACSSNSDCPNGEQCDISNCRPPASFGTCAASTQACNPQ